MKKNGFSEKEKEIIKNIGKLINYKLDFKASGIKIRSDAIKYIKECIDATEEDVDFEIDNSSSEIVWLEGSVKNSIREMYEHHELLKKSEKIKEDLKKANEIFNDIWRKE